MDHYEVGQILYTTSSSSFKVIPIQVVEEVIRTTIKGKEKTYMISFPDAKKTVVDIKKIKGQIFKTAKGVEEYLLENTKAAIKDLLKEADIVKSDAFGVSTVPSEEKELKDNIVQQGEQEDIIKVDLGDGIVGRLPKSQIPSPENK